MNNGCLRQQLRSRDSKFVAPREITRLVLNHNSSACYHILQQLALFDMPNLNRFDILSISIFCKIALSISISISIFSKITISISISILIFLELPYRYRYLYRYFSELPYRYRYFQPLHIDIDIFQKCQYIDNRYVISIYRTGLMITQWSFLKLNSNLGLSRAFAILRQLEMVLEAWLG